MIDNEDSADSQAPDKSKGTLRRRSAEDDALLRDFTADGKSDPWIAHYFGTTSANVRQWRRRRGIPRPLSSTGQVKARKPREEGLAGQIARLLGRKSTATPSTVGIPDEQALVLEADPTTFLSWLGASLFDYQQEALRLIRENDRVCLAWSRQAGKDFLTSLYALYVASTKSDAIVVCISPSQRQSDLWLARVWSFIEGKPELRRETDRSQSEIHFLDNGSAIYSLPSGSGAGATIRGFSRVSLVVVNEAAFVAEEVYASVKPFLATSGKGAKLILISTPAGRVGEFFRAWSNDLFVRSHVAATQCPRIPSDFLDKERRTMDSLTFKAEYMAEFLSAQASYFPSETIERCLTDIELREEPLKAHEGLTFYLGADWARVEGGDRTVLTVIGVDEDGDGAVLWVKSMEGVDYVQQAGYVQWLHSKWGFATIFSDQSAHAVNDLLVARGLPIVPVSFSLQGKIELFSRLKSAMESERLMIPHHEDMIRELAAFEYRFTEMGNMQLHAPAGTHDDYVASLALAARPLTDERGETFSDATVRWLSEAWG